METNYPKVLIVGPQAKDPQYSSTEGRRLVVDVVIIDKTGHESLHPVVYQLKQDAAEVLDTEYTQVDHLLCNDDDPFMVVGEVVEIDRQKKQLTLSNEDIVAYKHLITVSGSARHEQHRAEFSSALQALLEALKMRKHLPHGFDSIPDESHTIEHSIAPEISMDITSIDVEQIVQEKVCSNAATGNSSSSLSSSSNKRLFEVQL